jgi:hypothetical protein
MESFDTKDCDISESFDRKFEKFPSKDLKLEESANDLSESFPESFDRKFEKFPSKDSDLEESANELSESFESKDLELKEPVYELSESFESKDSGDTVMVSRNESKVDGRTRPRSVKQVEAYKRNFVKGDSIELRLRELDARMRHLQSLVLRLVHGKL